MQKVNVYLELEKALKMLNIDWTKIAWSHLRTNGCSNNRKNEALLKPDYSQEELEVFKQDVKDLGDYLDTPDEEQLFGVIVFKNDAWIERRCFDKHWRWRYAYKPEYDAFLKDANERINTGD